MRLILTIIFISITSTLSYAEELKESGKLYCGTSGGGAISGDESVIVSFLNGINNSISATEKSRKKLSEQLLSKGICDGINCIVEKFYNKKDGILFSLDDDDELEFVGQDLESVSANKAFARFITYTKIMYNSYKNLIRKRNPNEDFSSDNELVTLMNNIRNDFRDGKSLNYHVPFSDWGFNISEGWASYLKEKFNISVSYYLASIEFHEYEKFNNFYKRTFQSILTQTYLSEREFYKDDDSAAQTVTRTVEGLVTYLEEHFLAGKKVIVVAHSQGNHMIELAYGILRNKWGSSIESAIKVVGVASVASTTPNNTYITSSEDGTVLGLHDAFNGEPLPANFELKDGWDDDLFTDHGFDGVYLNHNLKGFYNPTDGNTSKVVTGEVEKTSLRDVVLGLVEGSIEVAIASSPEIESGSLLTASLRWEQYPDMDLWTDEPGDNSHVSYQNKSGMYGYLDRDDTDGEGPEHYSLSNELQCSDMSGKTWVFGIHQYPGGGSSAISHFSIKLGNTSLAHKSYNVNNWPSDIQWLGKVSLEEMDSNGRIEFTILLNSGVVN
jgi:hypothetical protein